MNDLYKALGDISSIRRQMASTTEFRGYGPATLATTGLFAILAEPAIRYGFVHLLVPLRIARCRSSIQDALY